MEIKNFKYMTEHYIKHKEFKLQIKEWEEWNEKHYIRAFIISNYWSFYRFMRYDFKTLLTEVLYGFQRMFRGYDSKKPYDLMSDLAIYILPKLKGFKEMPRCSYVDGLTPKEWEDRIDKMIFAMELVSDENKIWGVGNSNKQIDKLIKKQKEGMELFGKYFTNLCD